MLVPQSMTNSIHLVFSPIPTRVHRILSNSSPSSSLSYHGLSSPPPPSSSPAAEHTLKEHEPNHYSSSSVSSADLLKRKRPARINIPIISFSFPPVDTFREFEFQEDAYSAYCKRGKKGPMEDRYSAVLNFQGDSKEGFFGVFDGHGGSAAAEFAAKHMDKNIMEELRRRNECGDGEVEAAIKEGYLKTDRQFLNEDDNVISGRGGACCVTALIREGELIVSNAGDCRAVMSRGGVAVPLTTDHRPSRQDEMARIESLGGYVDSGRGVCRVQGSLAVSRGIGDGHLKPWLTAEPETTILPVSSDCEFLILASDGLWEKVDNQEAVDVIRALCTDVDNPEPLSSACKKLAQLSVLRGSIDDISLIIVQLNRFLN
ncbi:probable protein phosphatase 2C 25 [Impatiens glandulifera]|uniref:probable protein phosphatase 2C 25 n=1 Tax=Impatiens glandulifera TaxID=253017 RepID=UPI001FB09441|nr:probable protein phosphatase 2C 25 [Impatiens glandulifera]